MKRRDIIFLLVSTVILMIAWVIFTVIHQSVSSTINDTVNQQIIPIQPNFDTKIIDALKKRLRVSPDYTIASPEATPTSSIPTPRPTIVIPQSSVATQGGTKQ